MRIRLVLAGVAVGLPLGWFLKPDIAEPSDRLALPGPSEARAPGVGTAAASPPPIPSPPDPRRTALPDRDEVAEGSLELRKRIADLEARLAAARDAAEPRLASDRGRARRRLWEALSTLPLRHRSCYDDLVDFITVPSLIAEYPVEFAESLERLVVTSAAHQGPRVDPPSNLRRRALEENGQGEVEYNRFFPANPDRREGVSVRVALPAALPLGHPAHLEYSLYATFEDDGSLAYLDLSRQNQQRAFSLTRSAEGTLQISVARTAQDLERSPAEEWELYLALSACARRLASLGP